MPALLPPIEARSIVSEKYADGNRCATTTTSKSKFNFMTDPKFVAFSTQKGGAGKTTLTVLAASYLYYVKGLKVLVVDCDVPRVSEVL